MSTPDRVRATTDRKRRMDEKRAIEVMERSERLK
jgi:hypothetical protein